MNSQTDSNIIKPINENNFTTVSTFDLYNKPGISNTAQFQIKTPGFHPTYFSSNMYHVIHADEYFSISLLCFSAINYIIASGINKSLKTKLALQIVGSTASITSFGFMSIFMIKNYQYKPKVRVYYYRS